MKKAKLGISIWFVIQALINLLVLNIPVFIGSLVASLIFWNFYKNDKKNK